ncbi:hypothetical protein FJO98_16765 [Enterococcus sp. PF-2]|nr:hypothetical protein FJP08_16775 [Enterococcus sp. PF-3]TPE23062.1 hypothetical protein FJO98_16765 [Enterococcus sp. PF-2]
MRLCLQETNRGSDQRPSSYLFSVWGSLAPTDFSLTARVTDTPLEHCLAIIDSCFILLHSTMNFFESQSEVCFRCIDGCLIIWFVGDLRHDLNVLNHAFTV